MTNILAYHFLLCETTKVRYFEHDNYSYSKEFKYNI